MTRSALVIGATGATGKQVVEELISRDGWSRIVVLSRRPLSDISENSKVETLIADLGASDVVIDQSKLSGIDHFFNCIGTTRAVAGSAETFEHVEVGITEKVAKAAADAGIPNASVVSAQGANASQWGPGWLHFLFYGKVMGKKEEAMKSQSFKHVTVFRPGMLNRGNTDRTMEKMFQGFGLDVKILAKAMINDAERISNDDKQEKHTLVSSNKSITKLAESTEGN